MSTLQYVVELLAMYSSCLAHMEGLTLKAVARV